MVPLLAMVFNVVGMIGGYAVAVWIEGVDRGVFIENARWIVDFKDILQGGPVVGPPTLQRFFTIHVFVLPALITLLMYVHFRFIRAHGISEPM